MGRRLGQGRQRLPGPASCPRLYGVGSDGTTYDKAQEIKEEASPEFTDKSFKNPEIKARVYGETGVVMGSRDLKLKKAGKPLHVEETFTDVFVKRDGRWQVVASQGTALPKKAATTAAKPATPEQK